MAVMVVVAWLIERLVLSKLVNQEGITLLMATLGIAYFLDGVGQTIFGNDIYKIDVGMPKEPLMVLEGTFQGGLLLSQEDLIAALRGGRASWSRAGALLPEDGHRPRAAGGGRRPPGRAVHRHSARAHLGHRVVGGRLLALVAGIIWGSKLGVQFSLSLVALKALPVVILGGLTSIPGAIIGGLLIGVGEKLSEIYLGPMLGGGIEIWFAYVLALVFLLVRPQGLFGEKSSIGSETMFYRENGQFKSSYRADQQIFPIAAGPHRDAGAAARGVRRGAAGVPDYWLRAILMPFLILSLAALGLNILVGYCGQISLGTGAFMAVGAYAAYNFQVRIDGMPLIASLLLGGLCATVVGVLFGIPSLRIKGLYLAVATLAAQFFTDWAFLRIQWFTNNSSSGSVSVAGLNVFGLPIESPVQKYLFCLRFVVVFALLAKNLVRSAIGREWMAMRDMDVAAAVIGIRPVYAKLTAFAVSSFIVGVAGALWGFVHLGAWEPAAFSIDRSFQLLFMVIIGGLGSIMGSFFGAAFIVLLPLFLNQLPGWLGFSISTALASHLETMIFGALIVFFLIVEPHGLARLWSTAKEKLRLWPFPH